MRIEARRYDTGEPVSLEIEQGRIRRIDRAGEASGALPDDVFIAPGFVDVQVNGYGGQEFSADDLTVERVARIVSQQATFGVTRFCPTLTTAGFETLAHGMRQIAAACRQSGDTARRVAGIHLEGPYISPQNGARGAHPLQHCRAPDWQEFARLQEAAEGRIRLVTLSPEYDSAPDFIRRATGAGVRVAIGHTSADSRQIRAAVDAGATLSTHLGNGAHGMLRRHPNYLWDQLADDRLTASLIVDAHHLPPEVVQTFVRAKTPARCILVSDMSGLAGLPPGVYSTSLCQLEILPSGKLVIAGQDQLLAGASLPIGVGVANLLTFAGVDLATAVDMASRQPAAALGIEVDEIAVGRPANLVVFRLEHNSSPSGRGQGEGAAPESLSLSQTRDASVGGAGQAAGQEKLRALTPTLSQREREPSTVTRRLLVLQTIINGEVVYGSE